MASHRSEPRESVVSLGQRDNPWRSSTIHVTSAGDRRTHEVREVDLAPAARQGRYPALCGETITAASMVEPDVRPCPRCFELRAEDRAPHRPGLLRRIVGR